MYSVTEELSFNSFSIFSNINLDLDPQRIPMKGLHNHFLHTKFGYRYNMSTVIKIFSFNHFPIYSNIDFVPRGPKRNPMKGLHKLFIHTNFGNNMSTKTKDIQFQPFFNF